MALAPPPNVLVRTPIYRIVHIDCLDTIVQRDALHAPSCVPDDGLPYVGIHATETQRDRGGKIVTCAPGGIVRDYVGFYFGPRSPMLLRIHTGRNVRQVHQSNIIYLVSTAQMIQEDGLGFVFTDRHSLARVAAFHNCLDELDMVDFPIAYAERWNTSAAAPERQEKKQAEFLVHRSLPWPLIRGIGVLNETTKQRVSETLDRHPEVHRPRILRKPSWYY